MRKATVLIAGSPALSRLIRDLLRDRPQFKVVGSANGLKDLKRLAATFAPGVIVASVEPVKTGIVPMTLSIKRSSPLSKLILICPVPDLAGAARKNGADAFLDFEKLVFHLLPTASKLT